MLAAGTEPESEKRARYERYKARVRAAFEEKEKQIKKLSTFWRAEKRKELKHLRDRLFGPAMVKAEEEMPLRYWVERASDCHRGFQEALQKDTSNSLFRMKDGKRLPGSKSN